MKKIIIAVLFMFFGSCGAQEKIKDVNLSDDKIENINVNLNDKNSQKNKDGKQVGAKQPKVVTYLALETMDEFPSYDVMTEVKRSYNLPVTEVAQRMWSFKENCRGCIYEVPFIKNVEVFDISAAELIVWQDVVKKLWIFELDSQTFFYARQYRSSDGNMIVLDLETLDDATLEKVEKKTGLKDSLSFKKMKLRCILTSSESGTDLSIRVTGIGRGLTARVPDSFLEAEMNKTAQAISNAVDI